MKNSLNNNENKKINIDTIVTFCKDNARYVSAGVLTVILVVVLAVTAANNGKSDSKKEGTKQEQVADAQDEYAVNENKELNSLIGQYYGLYASGDVDGLAQIATPLSDMEKSYIQLMSGYVESYSNIDCYTKQGLEKNSYLVSATYDMKFNGVDGTVPGMESFYVRTNKDGKLYIDNLYSSFNSQMQETDVDPDVEALIEKFKESADVKALQADFQNRYTQTVTADANLQNAVNSVTDGIKNWASNYVAQQAAAEQAAAEQAAAEAAAQQAAAEAAAQQAAAEAAAQQAAAEQAAADQAAQQAAAEAAAQQAAADQAAQQQQDTNNGLNYLPEGTTLTANDAYNIRVSMSETSDKVGTTAIGDSLKVVLSYQEGWTKVEWKGKTGYIKTELLLKN